MKKLIILFISVFTFNLAANLQLMHASSLGEVSVSVDGKTILKHVKFLDNTGLLKTDRNSIVTINPANHDFTLDVNVDQFEGRDHIVTAIGPSQSYPNMLLANSEISVNNNSRSQFGLKILNGLFDETPVDIYLDSFLEVENLSYGQYSSYIQIDAGFKAITIKNHYTNVALGTYTVNLTEQGGQTGVLFLSGKFAEERAILKLINPSGYAISVLESNVEVLGLDEDGGEVDRDILETAQVQIVHNSPYPVVDVYVDGALALEDVAYRASTGLVDLPVNTEVGIAPADGDIIATFPFELAENGSYVVVASGIVGDDARPFNLLASSLEESAADNDHFALKVMHGVTDAPAVDIYANGSLLVENLAYGDFQGYLQVPVGDYTLDITGHGSTEPVASFNAPLSSFGGGSGVVYASGFLAPAETDSAFALVLTTPNGDVVTLPASETALSVNNDNFVSIPKDYIIHQNYPNPFNPTTSIKYELLSDSKLNITIYDMLGNVVDELYDGFQTSGNKSIKWDARNTSGELVSAGMYFYKIQVGNSSQVKRMMFLK